MLIFHDVQMAVFQYCVMLQPDGWVGHAGNPTGIVHADMTLTRSKVRVTGLLNFRQLAKPCMLAAMTAALSGTFWFNMLQMLHKCVCICIYICCVKIVTCLCRICLWWSYVSILRGFWNYTKRCRRIGRTVQVQVSAVVAELLQCDSCMWNLFMLVKCGDDDDEDCQLLQLNCRCQSLSCICISSRAFVY